MRRHGKLFDEFKSCFISCSFYSRSKVAVHREGRCKKISAEPRKMRLASHFLPSGGDPSRDYSSKRVYSVLSHLGYRVREGWLWSADRVSNICHVPTPLSGATNLGWCVILKFSDCWQPYVSDSGGSPLILSHVDLFSLCPE